MKLKGERMENLDLEFSIVDLKKSNSGQLLDHFHLLAILVAFLLLLSASDIMAQNRGLGLAQTNQPQFSNFYDHSYALVIGINKYENVEQLKYATNDAKSVAGVLQNNFGFDPGNVTVLLDEKAQREDIMLAFDRLRRNSKKDDRVFVFFAGHGMTIPTPDGRQKGYILPCDADKNDLFTTAISTDQLNEISQAIAAKHLFFVMDACYGGLIFSRAAAVSPSAEDYMKVMSTRKARKALTAGGQDQTVVDTGPGGHSVFTYYLINGLTTGAADLNGDGIITSSELDAYISPRVTAESNSSQTPEYGILGGDMGGDFIFVPSNAVMADMAAATFASNPDSAYVSIDGKYVGSTPLTVSLPPGKHFMSVSKEGYNSKSDTILLAQNGPNSFSYVLPMAQVEVNLTANVDTADVYVDMKLATRMTGYKTIISLPAGTHTIEIKKNQYSTASSVVALLPGNPYTLPFVLDRVFTLLEIKMDPDSAAVYIDGALELSSPGKLQIRTGHHRLTVKREGFETLEDTINVAGSSQEVSVALVPIKESLKLTTSPGNAVVSIDGKMAYFTPSTLELSYGTHEIQVEKAGYKPVDFDMDVSATSRSERNYRLALSTGSVANEILKLETSSQNALRWTSSTLTVLSGIAAIAVATETNRAYKNYMNSTDPAGINGTWERYRTYNVYQNALVASTIIFAFSSAIGFLTGPDKSSANEEAQTLDGEGLSFYDHLSVDTCFHTRNPVMVDISGGYGYTPLPGKIVSSLVTPVEANFDFPLGEVFSLRLGGGYYNVQTWSIQGDAIRSSDSLLWRRSLYCGKVGLGFFVGKMKFSGDYIFPLSLLNGESAPHLFPSSLFEFTLQTQVLPGVYAGLGMTVFESTKLYGVTYDQDGVPTYDISNDGPLVYPNLVIGFEL
jgi:hypothetical protein